MLSPENIRSINLDTSNIQKNKKTKKKKINYTLNDLENYTSKLENFNKDDIQKVLAKHQIKFTKFSKETDKFLDQIKEKVEAKKAKKTHKRVRFKEKSPEQVRKSPQHTIHNKNELQKNELQKNELQKRELQKNELQKNELEKRELQKNELQKNELQKNELQKNELETPDLKTKVLNKVANLKLQTYNQEESINRIVNRNKTQIAPYTTKGQLQNLYSQLNFHILQLESERESFQKKSNPKIINQIIQRKNEIKKLLDNINQLEKIHKPIPKYQEQKSIEYIPIIQNETPKFKEIEITGSIKDLESMNSNGKIIQRKETKQFIQKPFKIISYNPKITQLKYKRKIVDGSLRNKFKWKQNEIKSENKNEIKSENKNEIKNKIKNKIIKKITSRKSIKETEGDIDLKNDITKQKWISRMVYLPNDDVILPIININNKNIKEYLKNQSFESILLI